MGKTAANSRKAPKKASRKTDGREVASGEIRKPADFVGYVLGLLKADPKTYLIYILLYIPTGFFMNAMGQYFRIGEYAYWWQVLTCYGLYLIPASLLVRKRSYFDQYLSGLLIIAILELPAYSLGTSIAHPNSILDQYLTPRNYTLFMTVFFAGFIPLGNWAVSKVCRWMNQPHA
ncbi:MAG: hypothetical protein JW902_02315 [Syntrophaceae bacterium]|nr:hypothetical protein [Syntrophaceae bacterium]